MKLLATICCLLILLLPTACSNSVGGKARGKIQGLRYSPPGEWSGKPDETQVPGEIVKGANSLYGGALDSSDTISKPFVPANEDFGDETVVEASRPASPQIGALTAVQAIPKHQSGELALVLGAIVMEEQKSDGNAKSDAGSSVKEIIAKHIAELKGVRLINSLDEGNIEDNPQPDLVKQGVRFVVKGTVSTRASSNQMQVFLRVVETATGKINMIVSGQDKDLEAAAVQASERLIKKLEGVSA